MHGRDIFVNFVVNREDKTTWPRPFVDDTLYIYPNNGRNGSYF